MKIINFFLIFERQGKKIYEKNTKENNRENNNIKP